MIPLVLIGSIALVFLSLPIPAYQNAMTKIFGSQWKNIFFYIRDGTFNILSIIMVLCISYSYAIESNEQNGLVSPIIVSSVSLASFIAILGISKEGFVMANFGVIGVFVAIVVALSSSMLFIKLNTIEFLKIKAFSEGANLAFNYALSSIFPAAITIAAYAFVNQALIALFDIMDIQFFLSSFSSDIFSKMSSPFWKAIFFISLVHIFWFFGMHGSNILEPVAQSVFASALTTNQLLMMADQQPTEIFTKTFFDTFVFMGGCGTTLCLVGAILLAGKYKNQVQLAKLSFIPVMFNINELIVFGLPLVLNPVFVIPFLFVPVLLTVSSFLAMHYGLVPYTSNLVEWTTPIFLSGYTSTGSISGSLLQLLNLGLGIVCYMPFVRLAEGVSDAQLKNKLNKVCDMFQQGEERGIASSLLSRQDDIGSISRFLTVDLEHDLQNNKLALFYQPQVDFKGNVIGVEALLRWKHYRFGFIPPPLVIALAEESQLIDKLGFWILDTACRDLKKINNLGLKNITISVNVAAVQLENEAFIDNLEEIIQRQGIKRHALQIEITEQMALTSGRKIIDQIMSIKKMGVKLAMDDFGMGHSSLMYLKEYDFDTIKLDGSLVRELLSNNNCRNIISSIVFLGKSLNYSVLAEYVEKEEQMHALHELGCNKYQGYLYSEAIPYKELTDYISNKSVSLKDA